MCCYALWYRQRIFCNALDLDLQYWWKTKKININILIAKGGWAPSAPPWLRLCSWDLPRFIKDLETSGRQFIETESTAIRLRSKWSPPLFYVHFPILLNFLCLLSLFCWFPSNFAFIKLLYFWNSCRVEIWSDSIVVLSSWILLIFRTDRCQFSRINDDSVKKFNLKRD